MNSTVSIAGRTRTFTVVGDPDGPAGRALVLVFHGSKQTGEVHRRFTGGALDRLATSGRAVVVYLDGYRGNWNDARAQSSFPARRARVDDVAFAHAVVESVARSHGADARMVIGVGYSNGGQMVFRLLHESPEIFAGAVVVAATMPNRAGFLGDFSESAEHPVPLALVGGTADRIVPYSGGSMAWWARTMFRVGGVALSAPATAEYFARRNGIASAPSVSMLPERTARRDRTRTEVTSYRGSGRPPVTLYTVHGGGHTVPGEHPAPAFLGRTGTALGVDELVDGVLDEIAALDGAA